MTSSIATFNKDLSNLIGFLERRSKTDDLFLILKGLNLVQLTGYDIIDDYLKNRSIDKVFTYRLFVITLYGMVEKYVEDSIKEYVKIQCSLYGSYSNFPAKIKDGHPLLAINLTTKLHYPKNKHISVENIVEFLHKGINLKEPILIPESFLQNGGNYRHEEICKTFLNLDLQLASNLHRYEPLYSHLLREYKDTAHSELFYNKSINKLVDERNHIAHGGSIDVILDIPEMKKLCGDINRYIKAINNLLSDKINEIRYEVISTSEFHSKELCKEKTVIIPTLNDMAICKGDKIIARRSGGHFPQYIIHTISNIQIDGFNTDFVNCDFNREVGLELAPATGKNCKYKFMIKRSVAKALPV